MDQAATLDAVARLIHGAWRLLFVTGAGVSADSGLPTYRGIGGLYQDARTDEGIPIEEALSGAVFQRRPEITWKYLAQIERTCRGARPNPAHLAIAELQRRHPGSPWCSPRTWMACTGLPVPPSSSKSTAPCTA